MFAQTALAGSPTLVIDVWPEGKIPGNICPVAESFDGKGYKAVPKPRIELFKAKSDKPTGLVIVCPGGGYQHLAYSHEGLAIAEWLNANGISAAVLLYRIPQNRDGALMDIQRALRLARANAKDWNIDPDKIAVMGFSAGANLCARASSRFDKNSYAPIDDADKLSPRPDFTALIYPAYCDKPFFKERFLLGNTGEIPSRGGYAADYALAEELTVSEKTPPAFIVQTQDDKMCKNSSIAYYLALKKEGVPAILFMGDKGGHGYGLNNKTDMISMWPELCAKWFKLNGLGGDK